MSGLIRARTRSTPERPATTMRQAAVGLPVLVTGPVRATPAARRRLAELGVREGARIVLRARTAGGGAILGVGDARIAISSRLLAAIPVAPDTSADPDVGRQDSDT